jgi:hypothetical protein
MSRFLSRFERDALIACAAMATVAAAAWPDRGLSAGAGVLGGGLLSALSYRGLKGLVLALDEGQHPSPRTLVNFFTRHAILAVAAYVMLARLRLHPVAVLAGASSLVVAAAVAAVRALLPATGPGNPR